MYKVMDNESKSIEEILDNNPCYNFEMFEKNKKYKYYNIACAFDIETTSFIYEGQKCGIMYIWTFGLNGYYITGRTWTDFIDVIEKIIKAFNLNNNNRLVCYVHNLNFDFQFFRKLINWSSMLIDNNRSVLNAVYNGFEFRCSYHLSGYNLETVANNLHTYKCKKLIGDLNYKLKRNEKTELTNTELQYCYNDVIIIMNYIQELIEEYGSIAKLPLTVTGFVRQLLKENCFNDNDILNVRKFTSNVTINNYDEYLFIKSMYQGALTTANPLELGQINYHVSSIDFESSYIYSLICFQYPCSKFRPVKIKSLDDFNFYNDNYFTMFTITFYNLNAIDNYIYTISESKCFNLINSKKLNGKVYQADKLSININCIDLETIKLFYEWDRIEITNYMVANKCYLPKPFIKTLLDLYFDKTTLKGVEGKEIEYMNKKGRLNSIYGDCVTDIIREQIIYEDNDFKVIEYSDEEKENLIKKYNKKLRYNAYIWGPVCTSISKNNLCSMICEMKNDFLYCDTDSIKYNNAYLYEQIIENYNKECENKLKKVLTYYNFDINKYLHPIDSKGKSHTLGSFTKEPCYLKFKTLGAKRYMYQYEDLTYSFTISGLNKKIALPYILNGLSSNIKTKELNFEPLDKFQDGLKIPKGYTGRNTHNYIDYEIKGYITDFQHHKCKFDSPSSVYLEESEFNLSLEDSLLEQILYNIYEYY